MIDDREILLTIYLEGGLTQISKIVKNRKTGKKRRKNFKIPSEAKQQIRLGEVFIQHSSSIEGRPSLRSNFNAYANWKKYSFKERLEYHIKELVSSITHVSHPLRNRHYKWDMI